MTVKVPIFAEFAPTLLAMFAFVAARAVIVPLFATSVTTLAEVAESVPTEAVVAFNVLTATVSERPSVTTPFVLVVVIWFDVPDIDVTAAAASVADVRTLNPFSYILVADIVVAVKLLNTTVFESPRLAVLPVILTEI